MPQELTITRVIDAPIHKVWDAWSTRDHLIHWWGQPEDATMPYAGELDFRVGGTFHYQVKIPNGMEIWGKMVFKEIDAPRRLVFDDYYSDAEGNTTEPPMPVTVTLEEQESKTKMTIVHAGITGEPSIDQYRQGWNETLDGLVEYLSTL